VTISKHTEDKSESDLDKVLEVEKIAKYGTFLQVFLDQLLAILSRPRAHFESVAKQDRPLSVQACLFAIISIAASSAIFRTWAKTSQQPADLAVTFAITIACWLVYGSIIHLACRLVGGRGSIAASLSAMLQVMSVANLASMVLAFLVSRKSDDVYHLPLLAFMVAEVLLCTSYFTIAFGAVHSLGRVRRLTIGLIFGPLFVALNCFFFVAAVWVGNGTPMST
jgi:hypothetical protein